MAARIVLAGFLGPFCGIAMAQTEISKSRKPAATETDAIAQPTGQSTISKSTISRSTISKSPAIEPTAEPATPPPSTTTTKVSVSRPLAATGLHISTAKSITKVSLALTSGVQAQIFTLENPYRVVVDIPGVAFELPASLARQSGGLVRALRFGLIAPGRSRLVVEVEKAFKISDNASAVAASTKPVQLQIELTPSTPEAFLAALQQAPPPANPAPDTADTPPAPDKSTGKPVVMIDPGHGGVDGGASGPENTQEKDVVLAVAIQLRRTLEAAGRYTVRMTRDDDRFISLDKRIALSQAAAADLFISIHADAVPDGVIAPKAHGATVYTLSEEASHEEAQKLADKENAADSTAGFSLPSVGNEQIDSILSDLMTRETRRFSIRFRSLITSRFATQNLLARDPARAAAFKVLRQPQTPSVLIELGFMSNPDEVRQMQTSAWQARVARAMAGAVDRFFDNKTALNKP